MPERRAILTFKIPSKQLALKQSMDGVKKRKTRVRWKAGEKEGLLLLRKQHAKMPLREFQEKYYPDRTAKTLGALIRKMTKESGEEEDGMSSGEKHPSENQTTAQPNRPQKRTAFEFSDSEDEESSSDERIEDINPSGLRTPNKFIKLSSSTEAQSQPVRHAIERRDPIVRSQITEASQIPEPATTLSSRPRTTPETTAVGQDIKILESQPESTDKSPILHQTFPDQRDKCLGNEIHVAFIENIQQPQTQLETPKQEIFPEAISRQKFAKDVTDIYERLRSLCHSEEYLFSVTSQTRAQNSDLQKEYDLMRTEKDMQIARLQEEAKCWQVEREQLINENTHLKRKVEKMKDLIDS